MFTLAGASPAKKTGKLESIISQWSIVQVSLHSQLRGKCSLPLHYSFVYVGVKISIVIVLWDMGTIHCNKTHFYHDNI